MEINSAISSNNFTSFLENFTYYESEDLFNGPLTTNVEIQNIDNCKIYKFTNEFWTSKQRQANSIHEISYRACFKPQLPRFFIQSFQRNGEL